MQGHRLKLTCKGLNCKDTSYDYKVGRENYSDLEQTKTIKKNFEFVIARTQLKRRRNEERISHRAFHSKK